MREAGRGRAGGPGGGGGGLSDLLHAVAVDGPGAGFISWRRRAAGRLDPDVIDLFPTRLVLQTEDEAQSVRLIGRPDAPRSRRG